MPSNGIVFELFHLRYQLSPNYETGKTTFMDMLAGRCKEQRGKESTIGEYLDPHATSGGINPSLAALGVSYKPQAMNPKLRKFTGTVQEVMERDINPALGDRLFRLLVIKALHVDALANLCEWR